MVKKKIDQRIRTLIENGNLTRERSFFFIVGDRGKYQVVNLYNIMVRSTVREKPNVLWCYKKELGFSTHAQKRMKEVQERNKKGLGDPDTEDPFDLFVGTASIRFAYYKDSHKILGNTFGLLVLQDFEALTPNLLARTIETVEGGGMIVLLLKSVDSLKQLYTMSMDVHARFRTEGNGDVTGRFNERFLLSLASFKNILVTDEELNVLPLSSHMMSGITPITDKKQKEDKELKEIKASLKDVEPAGSIVGTTRSVEQAKAVMTFIEAISEKSLRSTVTLTAGRGRGKSAALGLAIASAVTFGYSNIFVTSPSPENLKTLFEFIFKGLEAVGMKEHTDYEIVQSTNPDFNKAIVRVNFFREHRQTIQYIQPQDAHKLGQAELVVIDEAAAIPLPLVKSLLGPYLVFMSSTINGYEGTGRSLSLKLIKQLKEQSEKSKTGRMLREVELTEPIRYAQGDPIEKWLNDLLCLDASQVQKIPTGFPHPDECELYYVNRDTLFSYHKASESFLQRLVALFVSSHYKNSPDDLLLMSDAPAHHLFVLVGPVDPKQKGLPEILCAVQVALEGRISKKHAIDSFSRGKAAAGDLIPWTISQQYQDADFPTLSGARVVRIATHPDYQKMKYGTRALNLLHSYYKGEIVSVDESKEEEDTREEKKKEKTKEGNLQSESIKPRANLPPLLTELKDRKAEPLNYVGVSYGLTPELYNFWARGGYLPVYIRQTKNDLTGENTCIMIKSLRSDDDEMKVEGDWLNSFHVDFKRRFVSLSASVFRGFSPSTALSIVDPKGPKSQEPLGREQLSLFFSPYDLKRLESYASNLSDYHVIMDMLPLISRLVFLGGIAVDMSPVQSAIVLCMGSQNKSVDEVGAELNLPVTQVLALFNKVMRKVSTNLRKIQEQAVEGSMSEKKKKATEKLPSQPLDDVEVTEEGKKEIEKEVERLVGKGDNGGKKRGNQESSKPANKKQKGKK
ncbi:hypothetical protein PROFUN_11545 [Planoprotostelium fungivorum]|uniref:RNA cytidine acetyltransferase n=1 Tax=Planoprotostelium fungivorum TaxID=1890364 RepID=A0A2P6N9H6_9EUKA|nr:hypothetical protein PROFUN_11545 [Planoprotostelium fungivorum]